MIIGNPPFLGAKRLKPERGPDYVNAIRRAYPDVPGMADYCVYWFRRAHDHLPACTADDRVAGRAGLVGTQNIRNNQSRVGGLDHVVQTARSSRPSTTSPGRARPMSTFRSSTGSRRKTPKLLPEKRRLWFKVDPPAGAKKARKRGSGPASKEYRVGFARVRVHQLGIVGQGGRERRQVLPMQRRCSVLHRPIPGHKGFMLSQSEAQLMLHADREIVRSCGRSLVGREMLTMAAPRRWVIDFQTHAHVRRKDVFSRHSPTSRESFCRMSGLTRERARNNRPMKLARTRTGFERGGSISGHGRGLIGKISAIPRYHCLFTGDKAAGVHVSSPAIRPGDALSCFALADDYSFGILQSNAHWQWFVAKCSKLTIGFPLHAGIGL